MFQWVGRAMWSAMAAATLMMVAGPAHAATTIVVNTGAGSGVPSAPIGPQASTYGQFTITKAIRITSIEAFGLINNAGIARFTISYNDAPGGNQPGVFGPAFETSLARTTAAGWFGVSGIVDGFDGLPGFLLAPGTYWVGLGSGGSGTFVAEHFGGATLAPLGNESLCCGATGYTDFDAGNLSWRIMGEEVVTTPVTPVPEPASWLMLILGMGLAGAMLRAQGGSALLPRVTA